MLLLRDENSQKAWVFDLWFYCRANSDIYSGEETVGVIFLTHTHRDHIARLDELRKRAGDP